MARLPGDESRQLEHIEGVLGDLGNARVLLRLVTERVAVAASDRRAAVILGPALDDIRRVERLIIRAQAGVTGRNCMRAGNDQ